MIYDTKSGMVVGNNVYDLKSQPKIGQTAQFDNYRTMYVGSFEHWREVVQQQLQKEKPNR